MSKAQSLAAYKGFNAHLHVTVTKEQREKFVALARRKHLSLSELMRKMVDDLEVVK